MSDGDTQGLPSYCKLIINIMASVTSTINEKERQDTINSHTHSPDTSDTHILTTPLSDCLTPPALVSLSVTHKHTQGTMTQAAVHDGRLVSFRYKK